MRHQRRAAGHRDQRSWRTTGCAACWRRSNSFFPDAAEAYARLAVATVTVLRRVRADQLPAELAALKKQRDALRVPTATDTEACAVVARLADRLRRPLPLPVLHWPTKGDPFDPPVLEEAEG